MPNIWLNNAKICLNLVARGFIEVTDYEYDDQKFTYVHNGSAPSSVVVTSGNYQPVLK